MPLCGVAQRPCKSDLGRREQMGGAAHIVRNRALARHVRRGNGGVTHIFRSMRPPSGCRIPLNNELDPAL